VRAPPHGASSTESASDLVHHGGEASTRWIATRFLAVDAKSPCMGKAERGARAPRSARSDALTSEIERTHRDHGSHRTCSPLEMLNVAGVQKFTELR